MFASEFDRAVRNDAGDRIGVRLSAALMALQAFPFGIGTLLTSAILVHDVCDRRWYQAHHMNRRGACLQDLTVTAALSVVTILCFYVGFALLKGKRWAANVVTVLGLFYLWVSGDILYSWFHPHKQAADEYFDIFYMPVMALMGLWWCLYLNWPSVRASFRQKPTDAK